MPDRFFCQNLTSGATARLDGSEVHHLTRVRRKSVGDEIDVFDGCGREASVTITGISKKTVDLEIFDLRVSPPPEVEITLVSAIPKADRFRFLIEKAVELGVDRFVPLITKRSVVKPNQGKQAKMEQAVIEACKQCGRSRLMTIEHPRQFEKVLEGISADVQIALLAHREGLPLPGVFPEKLPRSMLLLVGPEGGFTEFEFGQALGSGAVTAGLGPNILRIETAAITLAAYAVLQRNQAERKSIDD